MNSKTCIHHSAANCGDCRLSSICLPISLHLDDVAKLDDIVRRGRPLQKGAFVYRSHDAFNAVYAVRSGTIKTFTINEQGIEQVTGFYFPGEIFGMDGIGNNRYKGSAVALETSAVCEIPFDAMEDLSLKLPSLQRRFFQLMSKEITGEQQLASLLSTNTSEERIAAFLLSISSRNHRRQLSATTFHLSISRTELASYLGLTLETASRIFSRLQKDGVIKVDKKEITILNMDKLRETAHSAEIIHN